MKRIYTDGKRVAVADAESGERRGESGEEGERSKEAIFSFCLRGEDYEVFSELPADMELKGLRESWQTLGDDHWTAVSKAAELVDWLQTTRYCHVCGAPLERTGEICLRCSDCGRKHFPPMAPAVMVLVEDAEGRALLVHARTFRSNFYGLVAGFVETGETLEECVAREVKEETDLEIDDIRYVASQSWPFPHQLMIGFTARLKSGTLRFADGELTDGRFFSREQLPELPAHPSLARRLIDAWRCRNY